MKAIMHETYGFPEVLQYGEIDKPSPGDNEVLVEVHAASLNAGDLSDLKGRPLFIRLLYGLHKPRNTKLGYDFAGRVVQTGKKVKHFEPGDDVFGDLSSFGWGAFAEFVCAPEEAMTRKPANATYEEAAAIPVAAQVALQGLRDKGRIKSGQHVLINGASGGVGTFAVQIAKSYDTQVTAVCSTKNIELVRAIGADYVIDYTREDFTKNGSHYDLILAANGNHSIFQYQRALSKNGSLVVTGGSGTQFFQALVLGPLLSAIGSQKMGAMLMRPSNRDLQFLQMLFKKGKIKSIIDRRYSLNQIAQAMQYLSEGHAKGKIIINIKSNIVKS
ncbi:MAG: NAD(P)-dependent alcohol dehydrogenase [Saprospiraceae bacterium]|nr:NAD(P)-dependent alcohol dehydrogenase [Saprospiraceae bacterium]